MNLLSKKTGAAGRRCAPAGAWAALVVRCRAAHLLPALGAAAAVSLAAVAPAYAQGTAVLTGTVIDTATRKPVPDVVVTATSPALQGEQTVVTDASGTYRIPTLPPGDYTIRLESDAYKPISRGGINLRVDSTIRVNMEMLPLGIQAQEVVVVGKAPTVDVGSSSTGVTLNQEFTSRLALTAPGAKGAGVNSFESLATVAPGAQSDTYGVGMNGTTSPENGFLVDGVSVSDPAFGILGTPLSADFVKEATIITGGYLPEYGKTIGGIYDVVTKSGSNEFHGSVFTSITPGSLNGPVKTVVPQGSSEGTTSSVSLLRSFGADVGGPIVKDKLWFYAGVQLSYSTYDLTRNLYAFELQKDTAMDGHPAGAFTANPNIDPTTGLQTSHVVSSGNRLATQQSIQYIGKLEYLINQDHHLTLSVYGTPTTSGGNGNYAFATQSGSPPVDLNGAYSALGTQTVAFSNDVSLKYSGAFNNKRQLLDVTFGWHHQHQATNASDGSTVYQTANPSVLAGVPGTQYTYNHSITNFAGENVPRGACNVNVWTPAMGGTPGSLGSQNICPQQQYFGGGPGFLDDVLMDSYQAKGVFTDLLQLAGHHVIKAGVDFEYNSYRHDKGYSGTDFYQESPLTGGVLANPQYSGNYADNRNYGFLTGPDKVVQLPIYEAKTTTINVGGFLQDSWAIMDKVTLNFGFRYDAQIIYGADGELGLTLPNQWSPRIGIVYDFTQQGRSKLFANYARYYEGVPLDMADRSFPSEPQAVSNHVATQCNPANTGGAAPNLAGCQTNAGRVPSPYQYFNNQPAQPSQIWQKTGGGSEAVDPSISPQSSDEYVVGGEYEVFPDARLTVSYTHREMHRAIEDMSRDEANTYFIGNPGFGAASDFPKAVRNYDALTVAFTKVYASTWLLNASYVLSRLYGNYSGLFVPETGQLDPNINATFDLKSLLPNQTGPLPGDHTHQIKLFVAKDWLLPAGQDILTGISFRSRSGAPLNALGAHPIYGPSNTYIVPRGTGGVLTNPAGDDGLITEERSPWVHSFDVRLGYSVRLAKETTLALTMDIYNLFNFQAATLLDPNYTFAGVLPCLTGTAPTCLRTSSGQAFDKKQVNPDYGQPQAYQDPRQWRFGAKVTF